MSSSQGFWSYVHKDDKADGGRVTQLARDIVAQFEALTGDTIELFLDKDDLEWGDAQKKKIDDSLSNVAFFIPVLTPRYFKSIECRRELQFFARRAKHLSITELIMPILYIPVPELADSPPQDELMALVKEFQWEDWTEVRFAERASREYRRKVSDLAQRLVDANAAVELVDIAGAAEAMLGVSSGDAHDEPGILDKIAAAEEAMPRWGETMSAVSEQITKVGALMERGAEQMRKNDRQGRGFAGRLVIARRVAEELTEPANTIEQLSDAFASDLHEIDDGIRTILERLPAEIAKDPTSLPGACDFLGNIRTLGEAAREGLGSLEHMMTEAGSLEAISRDLRAPLRQMRTGLRRMVEARDVTDEWLALADQSGIDCPDPLEPSAALAVDDIAGGVSG
jgi:hypothetical protein